MPLTVSLLEDQEAMADLYDVVSASVVNIQVTRPASAMGAGIPGFGIPEEELPEDQSQGSGFIYDNDGHIITNNHVVEDAIDVLVIFANGRWAEAEVVATDPQADLAVIKVTPPDGVDWQPLELAEPNTLRVGHTVIAIGNPFGLDGTMTTGIVSALGRGLPIGTTSEGNYTLPDVIQTDAAINPGNSGGPLLDLQGRVIGVNFAIRSQVRSNAGVGFAIPVSIVHRVVPDLINEGRFSYAYLGLTGGSINAVVTNALDLPNDLQGVYVATVVPGGPSAAADIRGGSQRITTEDGLEILGGGDIITAVDGESVFRFEDLVSYLVIEASPGETITLSILREGEMIEVDVTLGERPTDTGSLTDQPGLPQELTARDAIRIAGEAVEAEGLLEGPIVETIATPDEVNGLPVWIVELVSGTDTAVVTIDAETGDVLELRLR